MLGYILLMLPKYVVLYYWMRWRVPHRVELNGLNGDRNSPGNAGISWPENTELDPVRISSLLLTKADPFRVLIYFILGMTIWSLR